MGPRRDDDAPSPGDQTARSADGRQMRTVAEEPAVPPSAADFWGERAEAVQDVLQGPAPPPPVRKPRPPSPTLPSREAAHARAMADSALAWQRRALSTLARPHWRRLIAAAGVIVVAGVAALLAANGFDSSPGGSASSHARASTAPKARDLHPGIAPAPTIPRLLTGPKHRASKRRPTHTAHRQKHTQRRSTEHSGSGSGATPVQYSAPPASSGSEGSSSSSGSSTSPAVGSPSPSTTSGSAGLSGTSSSSSSGSASSSGAAAPHQGDSSARSASASHSSNSTSPTGASGALGPIGSPNG
jgi:hypothetical protein